MEEKKVYAVIAYGGEWDGKWENVECVCSTPERAQVYIDEQEKDVISDELFEEIRDHLAQVEYDLQNQYYDETSFELRDGKTEEEYDEAMNEFKEKTQYEIIKEKWNISKESYDKAENNHMYDFSGYIIKDVPYFE